MGWRACTLVVPNVVPTPLQTECFWSGRRLRRFTQSELHECSRLICKAAPQRWQSARMLQRGSGSSSAAPPSGKRSLMPRRRCVRGSAEVPDWHSCGIVVVQAVSGEWDKLTTIAFAMAAANSRCSGVHCASSEAKLKSNINANLSNDVLQVGCGFCADICRGLWRTVGPVKSRPDEI